jgi:hypothetical protein
MLKRDIICFHHTFSNEAIPRNYLSFYLSPKMNYDQTIIELGEPDMNPALIVSQWAKIILCWEPLLWKVTGCSVYLKFVILFGIGSARIPWNTSVACRIIILTEEEIQARFGSRSRLYIPLLYERLVSFKRRRRFALSLSFFTVFLYVSN